MLTGGIRPYAPRQCKEAHVLRGMQCAISVYLPPQPTGPASLQQQCAAARALPLFSVDLTQRGGARSIGRLPGALVRRASLGLIHELVGVQAQQGSSCSHSCCSTVVAWRLACPPLRAHKPRLRRRR